MWHNWLYVPQPLLLWHNTYMENDICTVITKTLLYVRTYVRMYICGVQNCNFNCINASSNSRVLWLSSQLCTGEDKLDELHTDIAEGTSCKGDTTDVFVSQTASPVGLSMSCIDDMLYFLFLYLLVLRWWAALHSNVICSHPSSLQHTNIHATILPVFTTLQGTDFSVLPYIHCILEKERPLSLATVCTFVSVPVIVLCRTLEVLLGVTIQLGVCHTAQWRANADKYHHWQYATT